MAFSRRSLLLSLLSLSPLIWGGELRAVLDTQALARASLMDRLAHEEDEAYRERVQREAQKLAFLRWDLDCRALQPFRQLLQLECFSVPKGDLEHLESLAELSQLQSLTLSQCGLCDHDLGFLPKMVGLRHLHLPGNGLSSGENLAPLSQLRALNVESNRLTSLDGLRNLRALESLWVQHNPLSLGSQEALYSLKFLKVLELDGLSLGAQGALDFIREMPQLLRLSLVNCRIQELFPLESAVFLKSLDLSGNQIVDPCSLLSLDHLLFLDLKGNPLEPFLADAWYRRGHGIQEFKEQVLGILKKSLNRRQQEGLWGHSPPRKKLSTQRVGRELPCKDLLLALDYGELSQRPAHPQPSLDFYLDLSGKGLSTLDTLEDFPFVEILLLRSNTIENLRPLLHLSRLRWVDLRSNPPLPQFMQRIWSPKEIKILKTHIEDKYQGLRGERERVHIFERCPAIMQLLAKAASRQESLDLRVLLLESLFHMGYYAAFSKAVLSKYEKLDPLFVQELYLEFLDLIEMDQFFDFMEKEAIPHCFYPPSVQGGEFTLREIAQMARSFLEKRKSLEGFRARRSGLCIGEFLKPGEQLLSPDGIMTLSLSKDGELELFRGLEEKVWSTDTAGSQGEELIFQGGVCLFVKTVFVTDSNSWCL